MGVFFMIFFGESFGFRSFAPGEVRVQTPEFELSILMSFVCGILGISEICGLDDLGNIVGFRGQG